MADRPDSPLLGPVSVATVVFDAVVKPDEARLMAEARAHRALAIGGAAMVRGQVNLITGFFAQPRFCAGADD
jgi:shikimate 5-dehydrogenase